MINKFQGEYRWLSNFYECPIKFEGDTYQSTEAAFQAAKCQNKAQRIQFFNLNPSEAKAKGRHVKLRGDWECIKEDVMYLVCKYKFTQYKDLMQKLINTKDQQLIEGNTWNDTYWGMCNGIGKNKLGKILMKIREEIQNV